MGNFFKALGEIANPFDVTTLRAKLGSAIYFLTTVLVVLKAIVEALSGSTPEPPAVMPG